MPEVKKIVIIGPESTGKSTLTRLLSAHYETLWCPEYAREYLLTNGTAYTYEQLGDIAQGQLYLEEKYLQDVLAARTSPFLFIDTDMYVMKVWCEFVFESCHQFILDNIVARPADLYLLCNIDLPWIKDELREYPDLETREVLYHMYRDILINQAVPWVDIKGNYSERLNLAIKTIDHHFFKSELP